MSLPTHHVVNRLIVVLVSLAIAVPRVFASEPDENFPFERARSELLEYFEEQIGSPSPRASGPILAALALMSSRKDLVARFSAGYRGRDPDKRVTSEPLRDVMEYAAPYVQLSDMEFLVELMEDTPLGKNIPALPRQHASSWLATFGRSDGAIAIANALENEDDRNAALAWITRNCLLHSPGGDLPGARRAFLSRSDGTEMAFASVCQELAPYFTFGKDMERARDVLNSRISPIWAGLTGGFLAFLIDPLDFIAEWRGEEHPGLNDDADPGPEQQIAKSFLDGFRAAEAGNLELARRYGADVDRLLEQSDLAEDGRFPLWLGAGRAFFAMTSYDRQFLRKQLTGDGLWLQGHPEAFLIASLEVGLMYEVIECLNARSAEELLEMFDLALLPQDYLVQVGMAMLRQAGDFHVFRARVAQIRDTEYRMQILAAVVLSAQHHVIGKAFE